MNKFFVDKKFKFRAIILLLTVSVLCFSILLLNGIFSNYRSSKVLADFPEEVAKKLDETFEDNYYVNADVNWPTELVIPNGNSSVTASNGVIFMPDGTSMPIKPITLTQRGDYLVRYYYQLDGKFDYIEKTIFVGTKLASLTTDNGSIVAVTAEEQKDKVFENNASNVTLQGDDALIVRLKEGNTFTYNKSIDLTNVDDNGLCSLISLDFHMRDVERQETKFKVTKESARKLIVRISDSYDPTIYVDLVYSTIDNQGNVREIGLLNAKANSQKKYAGAFNWKEDYRQYIGVYEWIKYYKHHAGNEYALYNATTSTLGPNANWMNDFEHSALTWKYDPERQIVYANFGASKSGTSDVFINDLSYETLYGNTAFKGFPSNKVTLSIVTDEWVTADSARVDVFSLGECSGKELVEEYKNNYHVDDVATPIIDLGIERTEGRKVFVPYGSDFVLPVPVSIKGMAKGQDYKVKAFINYGESGQYEVPVSDGKLKINKSAIYTIEYSANNISGGVGIELLHLVVNKNVTESIKLNVTESFFAGSFESGQIITLPEHTVETINREDLVKVKIKAVHDKKTINVDSDSRQFILPYAGEYEIVYEISDNLYTVVKSYTMNVNGAQNYGFLEEIAIPKYFMKNAEYSLPNVTGYLLSGGDPVPATTKVFVAYDNGTSWTEVNREKVKITGSESLMVKYVCGSAEKISSVSKIVDVGYGIKNGLLMREYFIHDNFTIEAYEKDKGNTDLKYSLNDFNSDDNTLKFINVLDYSELDFRFKIKDNVNYNKVNVTLIDYYNPNAKYVMSFESIDGVCYVSYNGGPRYVTNVNFVDAKTKTIAYDFVSRELLLENVVQTVDLAEYLSTTLCYLEIELVGVTGASDFIIDAVNGTSTKNNTAKDTGNPRISINDFTGNYSIGDQVTVTAPFVTDVLSTVLDENITLTVMRVEDGAVMSDVGGLSLNKVSGLRSYTVLLDRVGEYKFTYTFTDSAGKTVPKSYSVFVVDQIKPQITFNKIDLTEIKIKKGATLNASFTVTDDVTPQDKITTALWVQDLRTLVNYTIHDENGLICFNYTGRYEVYAYAKDAAGNYSYKTVIVVVSD